jgi:hypothetical protein
MQDNDPVLSAIRDRKGLASELAQLVGITREAVWLWRRVPAQHARKVARYLKLKPYMVRPDLYPPPRSHRDKRPETSIQDC